MKEKNKKNSLGSGDSAGRRPTRPLAASTAGLLIFLVFLTMAAVFSAGYFFLLKDRYRKLLNSRDGQYRQLADSVEAVKKQASQMLKFSAKEERLIDNALPDKFDLSSTVIQIKELAANQGLSLLSIEAAPASNGQSSGIEGTVNPEGSAAAAGGETAPAKVSVLPQVPSVGRVNVAIDVTSDNYDGFKKFIAALSASQMIFDVRSIDFSPDSDSYKIDLVTYYNGA